MKKTLAYVDVPNVLDFDVVDIEAVLNALNATSVQYFVQGGPRYRELRNQIRSELKRPLQKCAPYKDIDTLLVSAIIQGAIREDVGKIIVVSGDADYLPGIKIAKRHGCKIVIVSLLKKLSGALAKAADEVVPLNENLVALHHPMEMPRPIYRRNHPSTGLSMPASPA